MYKNEILTNVLKKCLGGRIDTLENNYSHHTEKMMQSFKILDEMKQMAGKIDATLNEIISNSSRPSLTHSVSRREINRSFNSTSNTTSKTLTVNKSKVFENKKNDKSKTPIKRQTDKSIGKNIQRQKSGVFNTNSNDINNNPNKNKSPLIKNMTINKFNTIFKKEDENTLKRGVSKTPRNKPDISPVDRKNYIISKVNTPINRSPDISRNKTTQLISKKGEDKTNLSNISKASKQEITSTKNVYKQYNTCSNTNLNLNSIINPVIPVNAVNANISNSSSSNLNLKTNPNVVNTNDSIKFKISQNGNISQIIDIDNSMPDESLINNKDDLFITSTINENDLNLNLNNSMINNLMSGINFNTPKNKGIKLEYDEVLDDRWAMFEQYLNKFDKINLLRVNRKYGKYSLTSLIEMMGSIKDALDEKIQRFKVIDTSNANGMNTSSTYNFIDAIPLSKGTNKAIELLNDNLYVKLFTETSIPKPDILLVYKLYFQLIQHPFIQLYNNKNLFWKECSKYFLNNSEGKIGTFIAKKLKEVNISPENIYKIYNLLGDNVNKINPNNFSKICGTTGLFVFFIKDAIDYLGLGTKCDKNMNVEKCVWILTNLSQLIDRKIKHLQRNMNEHYNIY